MAADNRSPSDDPVIDAVKTLNAGYDNTDYAKRSAVQIGKARIYTVVFKGQDGYWHENYVYESGSTRIAYLDLERMLNARDNDLIPSARDPDYIRTMVVAVFTLVFGIAVVYVAVWDSKNPSLQVLTGLLGLGLGYFVGTKSPAQK